MALEPVIPLVVINYGVGKPREYPSERLSPLEEYEDEEFYSRFRFSKNDFDFVLNLIKDDLKSSNRSYALSLEQQLCVALRFYATGSFYSLVGDSILQAKQPSAGWFIESLTPFVPR